MQRDFSFRCQGLFLISRYLVNARSKIFVLLFICILFLMWLTDFKNIHTYIFFLLAIGLLASIKFFISELRAGQAAGTIDAQGRPIEKEEKKEK